MNMNMNEQKSPNKDNFTEHQEGKLDSVLAKCVPPMLELTFELSFSEFIVCLLAVSDCRGGVDPKYAIFAEYIRNQYVYR